MFKINLMLNKINYYKVIKRTKIATLKINNNNKMYFKLLYLKIKNKMKRLILNNNKKIKNLN